MSRSDNNRGNKNEKSLGDRAFERWFRSKCDRGRFPVEFESELYGCALPDYIVRFLDEEIVVQVRAIEKRLSQRKCSKTRGFAFGHYDMSGLLKLRRTIQRDGHQFRKFDDKPVVLALVIPDWVDIPRRIDDIFFALAGNPTKSTSIFLDEDGRFLKGNWASDLTARFYTQHRDVSAILVLRVGKSAPPEADPLSPKAADLVLLGRSAAKLPSWFSALAERVFEVDADTGSLRQKFSPLAPSSERRSARDVFALYREVHESEFSESFVETVRAVQKSATTEMDVLVSPTIRRKDGRNVVQYRTRVRGHPDARTRTRLTQAALELMGIPASAEVRD